MIASRGKTNAQSAIRRRGQDAAEELMSESAVKEAVEEGRISGTRFRPRLAEPLRTSHPPRISPIGVNCMLQKWRFGKSAPIVILQ